MAQYLVDHTKVRHRVLGLQLQVEHPAGVVQCCETVHERILPSICLSTGVLSQRNVPCRTYRHALAVSSNGADQTGTNGELMLQRYPDVRDRSLALVELRNHILG